MRRIILAAALGVAVIGGVAVTHLSSDPPAAHRREVEGSNKPTSGATREAATAAAITYATAPQEWLHKSDTAISADIARIASPHARAELEAAALREVLTARDSLKASPGPVWWLVRPLAWRIGSYTDTRAEVSLWLVRILSAVEVAAPQSTYATVTVSLEWHDGQWRLAEMTEAPGPTPSGLPGDQVDDAASFDQALRGFTRVGTEV